MLPEKLKTGDVIGIVSPSHVAQQDIYRRIIANIERKGFRVKTGKNLYKDTYGYLASEAERAEDFNGMVLDQTVKMVFFGGGYGALEILPYIDYGAILRNPKIFLSYSDGTSILNAIYAKTGLTTYYGQTPGEFEDLRQYDYEQFTSNLVRGDVREFVPNSDWHSLRDGVCEGTLVGGYSWNIALLLNNRHFEFDPPRKIYPVPGGLREIQQRRRREHAALLHRAESDDRARLGTSVRALFGGASSRTDGASRAFRGEARRARRVLRRFRAREKPCDTAHRQPCDPGYAYENAAL